MQLTTLDLPQGVRLLLCLIGLLVWAAVLLNCALDRYAIVTERYGSELHILSDGDIGISVMGFVGFLMFLAASTLPLTTGTTTPSPAILGTQVTLAQGVRTLQTVGLGAYAVMGVLWYLTLRRFRGYVETPNKRRTDPGYAGPQPGSVDRRE